MEIGEAFIAVIPNNRELLIYCGEMTTKNRKEFVYKMVGYCADANKTFLKIINRSFTTYKPFLAGAYSTSTIFLLTVAYTRRYTNAQLYA